MTTTRTLLFALSLLGGALAQQHGTKTTDAPSSFPTIVDTENTGALEGGTSSSNGNNASKVAPGADGHDTSSYGISTGGIVGIVVVIAVVILVFGAVWALWFTAKRRQWGVRDTLVYTSKRLTGRKGVVPPTPRTPRAPPASAKTPRRMRDLERGPKSSKPHPGWLDSEKERSSSRTALR